MRALDGCIDKILQRVSLSVSTTPPSFSNPNSNVAKDGVYSLGNFCLFRRFSGQRLFRRCPAKRRHFHDVSKGLVFGCIDIVSWLEMKVSPSSADNDSSEYCGYLPHFPAPSPKKNFFPENSFYIFTKEKFS